MTATIIIKVMFTAVNDYTSSFPFCVLENAFAL